MANTRTGLIAFMYFVVHDQTTQDEFKQDQVKVMNRFGLTTSEKQVITDIGNTNAGAASLDDLCNIIKAQVTNIFPVAW